MSKIIQRTLQIFEIFQDAKRPLTLTEIAKIMSIAPSSAHDAIKALLELGYIYEFAGRGGYYPTTKLYNIAQTIASHDPLAERVEPALRQFRDKFQESVSLCQFNGLNGTYVLVMPSMNDFRIEPVVGRNLRSLHATSAGKALLGALSEDELQKTLAGLDMKPLTDKSICDKARLLADIREGQATGIYSNFEESVPGVTTFSSPTMWGNVQYVVTLALPSIRLNGREAELKSDLLALAKELSR